MKDFTGKTDKHEKVELPPFRVFEVYVGKETFVVTAHEVDIDTGVLVFLNYSQNEDGFVLRQVIDGFRTFDRFTEVMRTAPNRIAN